MGKRESLSRSLNGAVQMHRAMHGAFTGEMAMAQTEE